MKTSLGFCALLFTLGAGAQVAVPPPESPGAIDSRVTQANIRSTICKSGYTKTVRPPVAYTSRLKRKLMIKHHLPGKPRDYELDHRIPLEVGGCPKCTANLWMEPIAEARRKDLAENELHRQVCSGQTTLSEAQSIIVNDWPSAVPKMTASK